MLYDAYDKSLDIYNNRYVEGIDDSIITGMPRLTAWYDARSSSYFAFGTGTKIATWYDRSGNNNHISQAVSANQPVFTPALLNGNSGVVWDGTTQMLYRYGGIAGSRGSGNKYMTTFCVATATDPLTTSYRTILGLNYSSQPSHPANSLYYWWQNFYYPTSGNFTQYYQGRYGSGGGSYSYNFNCPQSLFLPNIYTQRSHSGLGTFVFWQNTIINPHGMVNYYHIAFDRIEVGAVGTSSYPMLGNIHEIIITETYQSDDIVSSVIQYLAKKWGIPI